MKPNVGLTVLTSSLRIFFTIVVFPALSSPLHLVLDPLLPTAPSPTHSIKMRISLSLSRALRRIDSMPSFKYPWQRIVSDS